MKKKRCVAILNFTVYKKDTRNNEYFVVLCRLEINVVLILSLCVEIFCARKLVKRRKHHLKSETNVKYMSFCNKYVTIKVTEEYISLH
jgi:hypothetical protein